MVLNKKVFSVSEVNLYLKRMLESDPQLKNIWVRGEISNFKDHSSGHLYFALKDSAGSMRCVMFRSRAGQLLFRPENGLAVMVRGYLSVYERDGQCQLYAEEMLPAGQGALALAFEQLKGKLQAEGLFDLEKKKPLPLIPQKIGVVTSANGAAWQDIQKVIFNRFPGAHLVLAPATVQGESAPGEIAAGIARLNRTAGISVIIVGRGGGSVEELWAFNSEVVARAIAASRLPVVSAVGHQTDVTIADFVADQRAATPSAAAEMVVPVRQDLLRLVDNMRLRLERNTMTKLTLARQRLLHAESSVLFRHPERLLRQDSQALDQLQLNLENALRGRLTSWENRLAILAEKMQALSPLTTLSRGYAICRRLADGRVVADAAQVAAGEDVEVILSRGRLECRVTARHEEVSWK